LSKICIMASVQENVILHYKTFYFGKTRAETWNFSLPKKLDWTKTKLFRDRPSSFCSRYSNMCDRTKKMDHSSEFNRLNHTWGLLLSIEGGKLGARIVHPSNILHEGAFLPLLLGQNPTPENHAKLHFTIGIPSSLRSQFTWIFLLCLIWWNLQVRTGKC
jgi:hypothetical protein